MDHLSRPQTAGSSGDGSFSHKPKQNFHDYYDYSEDEEEESSSFMDFTRQKTVQNVQAHFRRAPSLLRSEFVKVGS